MKMKNIAPGGGGSEICLCKSATGNTPGIQMKYGGHVKIEKIENLVHLKNVLSLSTSWDRVVYNLA